MGRVSYDYTGETVVVTGGSSGIGREIAVRFGEAGATVINGDVRERPKDRGEERPTHEAIREAGGQAEFVETDVSDPNALRTLVASADEYGGVDVMANNAGWFLESPLRDVSPEEFDRITSINAGGVFFGCQASADDMIARGEPGAIVNTASISSTHAQRNQIPYDATKGAVRMITRGAALELADHDIRVNAVAPGHIATEFGSGAEKKKEAVAAGEVAKPVPIQRAGTPEDVAGAVLFLASEDASYVTGELLYVDGGWQVY
ncbi:short-chain dehydrogenase [halophilic archaeon]|nr:short-chain dehydrogenase [halophilic archaeon]